MTMTSIQSEQSNETIKEFTNNEIMLDFIKRNVSLNNINNIEINYGKQISDNIFDTRLNYKSNKLNNYDLIPMLNSLLSPYMDTNHKIKIYTNQVLCFENNTFIINKCMSSNQFEYYYYENNLEDYNINNTFCIKSKKKILKNPIFFTNMKTYNHKENGRLIEWTCFCNIKIQLKIYKTYLTLSLSMDIIENKKIPQQRLDLLKQIFDKLSMVYDSSLKE